MASTRLGPPCGRSSAFSPTGRLSGSRCPALGAFETHRDASAFEALVERHGRMVLAVCRGVLNDPSAAEDIFQATFLVLLRKAGSLWAVNGSLGSWLYRVAYRMAIEANPAPPGVARWKGGPGRWRMRIRVCAEHRGRHPPGVHEEIGRLPEKYRAPIVLCHLEQMTHAEAPANWAGPWGWCGAGCPSAGILQGAPDAARTGASGGVLMTVFSEQAAMAAVPRAGSMRRSVTRRPVAAGQAAAGAVSAAALASAIAC